MEGINYRRTFSYTPAAVGTSETAIVKLNIPNGTRVTAVSMKSIIEGDTDAVIKVGDSGSATRYINKTDVGAAGTITDGSANYHSYSSADSIQVAYTKGASPTTAPSVEVVVDFSRIFPN